MSKKIVKNERKRQQLRRERKIKRQRIIIRNLIIVGGFIVVLGSINVFFKSIKNKNQAQDIGNTTSQSIEASANLDDEHQKVHIVGKAEEVVEQEQLAVGNLVLVNNSYPIRDYSDTNMVSIGDYLKGICQMKSTDIKLQKEAVEALAQMLKDFSKEVGTNDLIVISGYRDFNTQEALHYESILQGQTNDENFVAKPDRSEHHTGLAIDFGLCYDNGLSGEYDGTGIYSWINENCYKYGFIVRYDESKKDVTGISHEPWHFRYVGQAHAQIMKEMNLCLEEYIELLKEYEYYTHPGQGITTETQNYSIYYVPSKGQLTHIPVPDSKDYIISGNNRDGFIVTVDLNR